MSIVILSNFELESEKDLTLIVSCFISIELVTCCLLFQYDIKDNAILATMQFNFSHIIPDKK